MSPEKNIKHAILKKRITDDGLVEIQDHVQLGTDYLVDINSITIGKGFNIEKKVLWEREIVYAKDGDEWLWFPTELLEIEGVKNDR